MYRFQVYEMQCVGTPNNTDAIFGNEDIQVCYDLRKEYGNSGFSIFNRTNKSVYINLDRTHSIINMEANTFYQGKSSTEQISVKSVTRTSNNSKVSQNILSEITTPQQKIVEIPSHSFKVFDGFYICESPYLEDGFGLKKEGVISFKSDDTPVVLKNIISYTIDNETKTIENDFWVKSIEIVKSLPSEMSKNKFYIQYVPIETQSRSHKGILNLIKKD